MIRRDVLEGVQRVLLAILVMIALAVVTLGIHAFWSQSSVAGATPARSPVSATHEIPTAMPMMTSLPTWTPRPGYTPPPIAPGSPKIGIVVGHWKNDSGAVCPDGLTEVEINLGIAQRVVALLSQAGYEAELLAEFSPKLEGYQAAALISIHADSCNVPEASGFKVARVSSSFVPETEDRLVACLIESYHRATGLPFHRNSITYDMTEYHAFFEIAPQTPAAIIEVGFMDADRYLLTKRQDLVAKGIFDGIRCFLSHSR